MCKYRVWKEEYGEVDHTQGGGKEKYEYTLTPEACPKFV